MASAVPFQAKRIHLGNVNIDVLRHFYRCTFAAAAKLLLRQRPVRRLPTLVWNLCEQSDQDSHESHLLQTIPILVAPSICLPLLKEGAAVFVPK